MPTHRIIRNVAPEALTNLAERLGAYFTLEPLPSENVPQWQTALTNAGADGQQNAFVLATPQQAYLARLTEAGRGAMAEARVRARGPPRRGARLDVAIL